MSTTGGVACATCTAIRGLVPVCYRPAGSSTITSHPIPGFFWITNASINGAPPRQNGASTGTFTNMTGGSYEFGLCARRSAAGAGEADFRIFYYNVVAVVY